MLIKLFPPYLFNVQFVSNRNKCMSHPFIKSGTVVSELSCNCSVRGCFRERRGWLYHERLKCIVAIDHFGLRPAIYV